MPEKATPFVVTIVVKYDPIQRHIPSNPSLGNAPPPPEFSLINQHGSFQDNDVKAIYYFEWKNIAGVFIF